MHALASCAEVKFIFVSSNTGQTSKVDPVNGANVLKENKVQLFSIVRIICALMILFICMCVCKCIFCATLHFIQ